jgi:lon-related putative ATP-dependent protease
MDSVQPLAPSSLCWRCDPRQFRFETTDQVQDLSEFLGQDRALDAVQFGIGIQREGYNLYVLGPPGVGKRTIVQDFLERKSAAEPTPDDWCYVNNFDDPHQPQALHLPAGRGEQFVADMEDLIDDLRTAIPAALEMEEHKSRLQKIEEEAKQRQDKLLKQVEDKARQEGIQLIRAHGGFGLAPIRDGEVLSPEDYEKLSEDQKNQIKQTVDRLQAELKDLAEKVPRGRNEVRRRVQDLNRDTARIAIGHCLEQLRAKYTDLPEILEYLDAVEADVIENTEEFRSTGGDEEPALLAGPQMPPRDPAAAYRVNLIVDNSQTSGAPVIYEEHPNYQNLLGRVEHEAHLGTLLTDFALIKPGALHRANGGYLVIEAQRLLMQPYAWEALKRALYSAHIKIESLAENLGLAGTVSLEPEPIPMDVKIVLLGERRLYYLLYQLDPDFAELFKVAADFEEQMDRTPESCQLYAQLIATLVRRENHLPFDRSAVARVLEHSARVAADAEKLTTHMRTVADLIREADYWASHDGGGTVRAAHVQQAIDKQIYRSDRLRQQIHEQIHRGTMLIDTSGEQVGQVNGLSVLDLGNFAFGKPSRITATARLGKGEVVDIEREVELGGAIHSKGVLILSAFLGSRYARNHPLCLTASLVFEQSYGLVDGDSASLAELCALLSALSGVPLKQSLAVTGSVNQQGQVQPIGGVNEKIEGFFDVCCAKGLTGQQGVLIPHTNVRHLMLRQDVVDAVAAGQFQIYPVETVDQAVQLLTGIPAGRADDQGRFETGSVNQRVAARLLELFELRQQYTAEVKAISESPPAAG